MIPAARGAWPAPQEFAAAAAAHPELLLQQAQDHLRQGRHLASFLCADRLCRVTASSEAVPLLLRSAALAMLGDRQAARADLDLAALVNPESPLIALALMKDADAQRRREGAQRAFLGDRPEAQALAASVLFEAGCRAIIEPSIAGDDLLVRMRWRGEPPTALASDGQSVWPLACEPSPDAPPAGGFPASGEARLPWPPGRVALRISGPEGAFVSRAVVRRPADRTAGAQAATPAPIPVAGAASQLMIVIPVYDDAEATQACFEALSAARPASIRHRVIVVDDDGPDPGIRSLMEGVEARGFALLRNPVNLGFAESVNRAMALRQPDEDVLLLNADAFLPAGAIERLKAAADQPDVGTVTPLSNNGEDTSIPQRFRVNPLPPAEQRLKIDRLAATINAKQRIDLPNGIGFCLYIASAALDRVGLFSAAFGRGYYEDVEFCLRAARLGFRNVCAADVYVGHAGSRSFRGDRQALVRRNLSRLLEAFPGHRDNARQFRTADPLRAAAALLEAAELATRGTLDILLLPPDCPGELAHMVARALPGTAPRLSVQRDQAGDTVHLRDAAGGMPQNLDMAAADWSELRDNAVRKGRIGHVASIASGRCNGDDVAALRKGATAWLDFRGDSLDAASLRLAAPPHPAPRLQPGGGLALVAFSRRPELLDLARAVARRLHPARNVALLGRWEDDVAAMADGLWVTGAMDWDEVGPWMERSGLSSLAILDRAYATMLPLVDAWSGAGLRIACFGTEPEPRPWLALDPALDDEAAAGLISAWVITT